MLPYFVDGGDVVKAECPVARTWGFPSSKLTFWRISSPLIPLKLRFPSYKLHSWNVNWHMSKMTMPGVSDERRFHVSFGFYLG